MKENEKDFNRESPAEQAAAEWTLRIDRGLTAEEQDEYTEWLAADPSHREAMSLYQWGWDEFDRLAGLQTSHHARVDPDLLAPGNIILPRQRSHRKLIALFAAFPLAAVLALAGFLFLADTEQKSSIPVQPAIELLARIEQVTFEDGSVVEINRGARIEGAYTPSERRVYLLKGEANFEVAKDPNRPFIVNVAGVDVKAVGTVFSVKLSDDEVDVIVTEGKVSVKHHSNRPSEETDTVDTFIELGQRAKVRLASDQPSVLVSAMAPHEIEAATLWQPRLLDFDSAPLGVIVEEFNRSNPIQVVLGDPTLEMVKLSSSFWSDNVEGFVRLMESSFNMKAEWRGSREIVLRDAN
ncbi:MAG: FecR domain-containing protein [Verrucomicrobiae bacterium]|nr:FecR domain-containing protein [Verrucomicrobiae bacterium]